MLDFKSSNPRPQSFLEFKTVFSLDLLFDFWREEARENNQGLAVLAQDLMRRVASVPELHGVIQDRSVLLRHPDLVRALLSAVLPAGLKNLACSAVAPPASWEFFQATPRFEKELMASDGLIRGDLLIDGLDWDYLRSIFSYLSVLRICYGVSLPFEKAILIRNTSSDTGLLRTYQMRAQFDMLRIRPIGELPQIDIPAIQSLGQEMGSLDAWRGLIPAEKFEFYGFVVYGATDVSDESNRAQLTEILVQAQPLTDSEAFARLQQLVQAMLGLPQLAISVVGVEGDSAFSMDGSEGLQHNTDQAQLGEFICESCRSELFQGEEVLHKDLREAEICSNMLGRLKERGGRSFLMLPLRQNGELLGALCLTTPSPDQLTSLTKLRLEGVIELFSLALGRTLAAIRAEVQAVMKEKFTAIHPSVEWKFRAAALHYVRHKELDDVQFPQAHSLYSSSDIRSSSDLRHSAIRKDLVRQIHSAKEILEVANESREIDYLNSMVFKMDRMISELESGAHSGDEVRIARLLATDVEPVFESLESFGTNIHDSVEGYRRAVCSNSGSLFQERRAYEDSVDQLTRRLTDILTERQAQAQETFPHLFEMYRTDGVEHTIYVGNSLTERDDFSKLYLNELRLWQLRTVCLLAQTCFEMEKSLPQPLQVAHLIFAPSEPVGLRFSQEEKTFNVDGAYNTSYEIIKKRIDKAHIKGTGERLTQPGKIALVYSHAFEANEYRSYFEYLHQQGLLDSSVEDVDLEDLQGVYGLKALRVRVTKIED